ncbi:MAG: phosphate ABC transporter permease PstA [Caulobacteraceae bacterium]
MTEAPSSIAEAAGKRLAKRYAAERRFQWYGRAAIIVALAFLVILIGRIVSQGISTFWTHEITVAVYLDPAKIDRTNLPGVNFDYMVSEALLKAVGETDDDLGERSGEAGELASRDFGFRILDMVKANPNLIGQTVTLTGLVGTKADLYFKGEIKLATPESERQLTNRQIAWLDRLKGAGAIRSGFNTTFLTHGDSTEAEQAGVLGAIIGSAMTLLVAGLLAVPIGVLAAVWLEEFAPKNRWTDLIEVNVNNLAAVPSIVYGLLGLAVFINWLHVPRSSPLVGGLVLALMALPTMIIATRSALKAVPPSVREAALGVGASKTQTVFHHVLPLAGPGIMTGAILSMSHALGETAPLLMIGMVISMTGLPQGFASAATVLPVQVFIWENASERGFHERTAAAIMVLLTFMIIMNGLAIFLRSRFERRW